MIFKNYYKLLDLPKNVKSTQNEIKTAYRVQAKKYHPDVNIQNRAAEERFKDITEAYRILSDPIQKKKYDRSWNNYVGKKLHKEMASQREIRANDIVNMFFGKNITNKTVENKTPLKGENIETTIELSVKEAFDGTEKRIGLTSADGKKKNILVKIPAGIKNGKKMRIAGKGKKGKNGGNDGDLIIGVKIVDNGIYKIVGDDINVKMYLTPWDAALGSKVAVDGIDGQISIIVPKGTQNGDKLSIPNKGYYKNSKERGNLVVSAEILIPKKLSDEEKRLFTELKKKSSFNTKNIVNIK
mgnify:CR=1 FL=1